MTASDRIKLIEVIVPLLITIVTVIPTIISNRKKTQGSIQDLEKKLSKNNEDMEKKIDTVSHNLTNHIAEDEEDKARQARIRILRFYDEVCEGREHSESHFEDILDDCDFYELYSDTHPKFKNNRGHIAIEHIRATYSKVKAKGGFLVHKDI